MEEQQQAELHGLCDDVCNCTIEVTYGLPCYHTVARHKNRDIPISCSALHRFWTQLEIPLHDTPDQLDDDANRKRRVARSLMDELYFNDFPKAFVDEQYRWATTIYGMRNPHFTNLKEPQVVQTKGRPRGSLNKRDLCGWEYTDIQLRKEQNAPPPGQKSALMPVTPIKRKRGRPPSIHNEVAPAETPIQTSIAGSDECTPVKRRRGRPPLPKKSSPAVVAAKIANPTPVGLVAGPHIGAIPEFMNKYVNESYSVAPDGNCGFREIARSGGHDEEDYWKTIRRSMITELQNRPQLYAQWLGGDDVIARVTKALDWFVDGVAAPTEYWLSAFDMGSLVATTFNSIFIVFSPNSAFTVPPLTVRPDWAYEELGINTICLQYAHFSGVSTTFICILFFS